VRPELSPSPAQGRRRVPERAQRPVCGPDLGAFMFGASRLQAPPRSAELSASILSLGPPDSSRIMRKPGPMAGRELRLERKKPPASARRRGASILLYAVVGGLLASGCGAGESTVSSQRAAFEQTKVVPIGRSAFLRMNPATLTKEQRKRLVLITGGGWVQNGLFIFPDAVDADCRAHIFTKPFCARRSRG
jgi:hypothetical protein